MKKTILFLLFAVINLAVSAQGNAPFTLPTAKQWKTSKGTFTLDSNISVQCKHPSLTAAAEYLSQSLQLSSSQAREPVIELRLATVQKNNSEAYRLVIRRDGIVISGATPQAVLWGIQTLLQLREQNPLLPCGTITDWPDYPLRGFMIDCGRKFIPLDYLRNLVRTMSYYKMNCLQVHLNDNGFRKYSHNRWEETYAAFRLESTLFPELTARDGYYTKQEFRDFILESQQLGVEIIPEIDAPAHALAFTRFRPSLACEEYGADHLDLRNPQVIPFLDSLWSEYIEGPQPIFAGPRVHIGTDEYSNKDQAVVELFRGLTDHLLKYCLQRGKKPVMWGALTHAKGETPVQVDSVLVGVWNNGYANPQDMHNAGYQLLCIPDGYLYIVPAAGYYYDYLNDRYLWEHWTPAHIGNVTFPERDSQIEGGMFAVWNDVCGNGISVGDIHHRVFPALQVLAEKNWHAENHENGYPEWNTQRALLGEGPGVNELGTTECQHTQLQPNATLTPNSLAQIGYDYQVDFDITWATETPGTALTFSPRSSFYLSDPIRGMLGFSRDGYLFTFHYSGRPGITEHISIRGNNRETSLWINDKLVQTLGYDEQLAADKNPYNVVRTLVFPLQQTGDFHSSIRNFNAQRVKK